jgi:hypothetical protein
VDVIAPDIPLAEEVDGPAIHAHRSDGQDDGELAVCFAGVANLHCDLVAHVGVEVREGGAGDWLEVTVPPMLAIEDARGWMRAARINAREIPALRVEALQE